MFLLSLMTVASATEGYSRIGSTFWWRLPRKNPLATWIFKEKSRITSNGIPSAQLPAKDPRLRFDLPDDIDLLRMCVLGDVHGRMAGHVDRTARQSMMLNSPTTVFI
jgi:hypothetical protein